MSKSRLAEILGVEEGQEFKVKSIYYGNAIYRIRWGSIERYDNDISEWLGEFDITLLCLLIENPKKIVPILKYSEATIEAAIYDSYRFKYVARDRDGYLQLSENAPKEFVDYWYASGVRSLEIKEEDYPEIKPMECIALADIVQEGER